jgi:hypothetical protein
MKDLDRVLELLEQGAEPDAIRAVLDPEGQIPDMTPEQIERFERRLHDAVVGERRRFAGRRRVRWVVSGGVVAACCAAVAALAMRSLSPPGFAVSLEGQAAAMAHDVLAGTPEPAAPPTTSATTSATSGPSPRETPQ